MGRWVGILVAIPLHALLSLTAARAMETGNPVFVSDVPWEGRGEVYFDGYERELDYTGSGVSPEADMKLNLYGARLYFPAATATAHIEAGGFEGRNRNGKGVFLGAGASLLATRIQGVKIYGTAAASYVPVLSYDDDTTDGLHNSYGEQFLEMSAGALATTDIKISKKLHITPHLGLLVSIVRGSGHVDTGPIDGEVTSGEDYKIEEATWIVGNLGASLFFHDQFSVRAEGRFLGERSYSLSLGYAF